LQDLLGTIAVPEPALERAYVSPVAAERQLSLFDIVKRGRLLDVTDPSEPARSG
jgi:hypothetical protein